MTPSPAKPPREYVPGPLLDGFWVHPWTEVDYAVDSDRFVVVIGTCTSTRGGDPVAPARQLLSALVAGEGIFFQALSEFTGRHALIFGTKEKPKVVTDASGMRSVFYVPSSATVASHARLADAAHGAGATRDDLVFHYGYPGHHTPFPTTRLLTPNTYLDIRAGTVARFWPTQPLEPREVDDVAEEVIERTVTGITSLAAGRPVRLALTSGLDSRLMLGLVLRSGIDFETYTYGSRGDTAVDRAFAVDFSQAIGIRHSLIASSPPGAELSARLAEANSQPHHHNVVKGLIDWFPAERALVVTTNLAEIGRRFFAPMIRDGVAEPRSPETLAELYRLKVRWSTRQKIDARGRERWSRIVSAFFAEFASDTDFFAAADFVDPFDLFYWEHRMGAWHGPAMNERDFYGDAFIPLNVRSIFEGMLGISAPRREDGSVFHRMLDMLDPRLLDFPINPRRWPGRGRLPRLGS